MLHYEICKPLVLSYQFYCMALYHSQSQLHVINGFITWALMQENLSSGFANNKGAVQPAHPAD